MIQGGDVMWTVIDEGQGIPKSVQGYLFERFFTLPASDSRKSKGTGLGLPVAMAIAQLHRGTIEVKSSPGRGSAFTLRVPVNEREENK
jgi:signal transduction histidine kinase